jgi:tetratricopeptide (TPR) repeat protein
VADSQRIEDLRRRVQTDPASIAFAQLAEECRRAGHYQESVDVCRAGLELHPGYLSARVTLGRALIELNDLETALAELQHVLKSAPENLAAIRGVAEIHHRQGSLAEALAQYRAALALARNDPDLQRTVEELARQVEPPPPLASADGLTFEQMQDEFLQNLMPPPPPPPAPVALQMVPPPAAQETPAPIMPPPDEAPLPTEPEPVAAAPAGEADPVAVDETLPDTAARDRSLRLVAVLEQWLDAIHVVRAEPRA